MKYLKLFIVIPFILLVLYFLFSEYKSIKSFIFVIDDAWIHLKIARNIAMGYGYSYNPGTLISASTAPLYTLILAFFFLFSKNIIFNVYFISIISTFLVIYFSYKSVLILTNNIFFSLLTAFFVSVNPWISWNALSGMEISLGSFILCAGFYFYLKSNEANNLQRFLPVILFSLITQIRPESYSILVLYYLIEIIPLVSALFIKRNRTKKTALFISGIRDLLIKLLLTLAIILPYGLFSYRITGSFFPNTYTAKVGNLGILGIAQHNFSGLAVVAAINLMIAYIVYFFLALKDVNLFAFCFLIPAVIVIIYRALKSNNYRLLFLPGIFILFPLMVGLIVPADRISYPWYRHMIYLTPLFIQLAFAGFWYVFQKTGKLMFICLLIVIMINAFDSINRITTVKSFFLYRVKTMKQEHLALADWMSKHISPDAVIAASDIGVVGFYTKNFIYDIEGLINPDIRYFAYRRDSAAKDKETYRHMAQSKPDFFVTHIMSYQNIKKRQFTLIKKFDNLAIYKTPWTRENLLFKETF